MKKLNEMLNATETTTAPAVEIIEYDFSKLVDDPRYASTVTFDQGYDKDDNGNLWFNFTNSEGKRRRAVAQEGTYFTAVKGQTMKVAIDTSESPWIFLYPNATSHPLPAKEEAPAEVVNFRKLIVKA